MPQRIVYRADAAAEIGTGHIVRGLALAEAMQAMEAQWAFACRTGSHAAVPALAASRHRIIEMPRQAPDEPASLRRAMPEGCDLLIVDHYGLACTFEAECRSWADRILAMEDLPGRAHDCDLLLDPTVGRTPADYDDWVPIRCAAVTGVEYASLRPQFAGARTASLARRAECGKDDTAQRVLIALGGSDPDNRIALAIEGAVQAVKGTSIEIDVVLPSRAPHFAAVRDLAKGLGPTVRLHGEQDAGAMAALMSRADLAIGAGGSMAWERCVLGLPTIVLTIADNQRDVAHALVSRGAAVLAGPGGEVSAPAIGAMVLELAGDPGRRAKMARAAARICDGRGAMRVAALLTGGRSRDGASVMLRPSARADRDTLFAWQQIPDMRRYFKNPQSPTAVDHAAWFTAVRADPRVRLFLIIVSGKPAGTLRLEETETDALKVSILVAPEHLRRGVAGTALGLAHAMWPQPRFLAEIHPGNDPSLALFAAAGYTQVQPGLYVREPEAGAT